MGRRRASDRRRQSGNGRAGRETERRDGVAASDRHRATLGQSSARIAGRLCLWTLGIPSCESLACSELLRKPRFCGFAPRPNVRGAVPPWARLPWSSRSACSSSPKSPVGRCCVCTWHRLRRRSFCSAPIWSSLPFSDFSPHALRPAVPSKRPCDCAGRRWRPPADRWPSRPLSLPRRHFCASAAANAPVGRGCSHSIDSVQAPSRRPCAGGGGAARGG